MASDVKYQIYIHRLPKALISTIVVKKETVDDHKVLGHMQVQWRPKVGHIYWNKYKDM